MILRVLWRKTLVIAASAAASLAMLISTAPLDATPASATSWGWCTDPYLGGTFLCPDGNYLYGEVTAHFPNYSRQIFVIGTNWALWTRWNNYNNGGPNAWSPWYSMGGESKCCHLLYVDFEWTWTPRVIMVGTDGRNWYRQRYGNGSGWTNWNCCAPTPYPL